MNSARTLVGYKSGCCRRGGLQYKLSTGDETLDGVDEERRRAEDEGEDEDEMSDRRQEGNCKFNHSNKKWVNYIISGHIVWSHPFVCTPLPSASLPHDQSVSGPLPSELRVNNV